MIVFMLSSHQPWPWLLLPPHAPCSCSLSILDTEYLIHISNSQQQVITGTAFNCHHFLLTLLFSNQLSGAEFLDITPWPWLPLSLAQYISWWWRQCDGISGVTLHHPNDRAGATAGTNPNINYHFYSILAAQAPSPHDTLSQDKAQHSNTIRETLDQQYLGN